MKRAPRCRDSARHGAAPHVHSPTHDHFPQCRCLPPHPVANSAWHFGPGGIFGVREACSVRGHPCPHVPNPHPRQPHSRHNDGPDDNPHNQGSAFTMKALHMALEGIAGEGAGAPRVARSGEIWAVRTRSPVSSVVRGPWVPGWGTVGGNHNGTAGRDARGPKLRSSSPCPGTVGRDGFTPGE